MKHVEWEMTGCRVLHVHSFTANVHGGSPAGVCLHEDGLDENALRRIAIDLGPSVTAFVGPGSQTRRPLRWFTREGAEVQSYCGHATFAAAHVLLTEDGAWVDLETISGVRRAVRKGGDIELEIPAWAVVSGPCPADVIAAIGRTPAAFVQGDRDRMLIFRNAAELRALSPEYALLYALGDHGFICAAPGDQAGTVAFRFFCPGFNIGEDEDPATGSAHSTLAPYWMDLLGVDRLVTHQLSHRGATFRVDRVGGVFKLVAPCATFLDGYIQF